MLGLDLCRGLRLSRRGGSRPRVLWRAEKRKSLLARRETRRRNPLQGARHPPGRQGLAAACTERRGIRGPHSDSGGRSIGDGLSRRPALTIRQRRPLSARNHPSTRSDETATTAPHERQVAPVPDLLALAVLPYRADPMMSRRFQIGEAILSASDPQLAPALTNAHARRIRPLCLCREPAAPMYVARVAGPVHSQAHARHRRPARSRVRVV